MPTAAVYVRVSSRAQAAAERTSLADQEKECRAYAARESWPVAGAFADVFTGYESADQRPALQQVRDLIQTSGADVVLVWKFDRAARDQVDLMVLNREVRNAGARLVSAIEGPIENTAMDRLKLGLLGGMAELERESIILRTHGAIRTRAESGKLLTGPVPKYGYNWTGEHNEYYAINPETAPTVERLYQMADGGMSLHEMTRVLNADGVQTPSQYLASSGKLPGNRRLSTEWSRQGIYQLLTDPSYCGRHVAYRRRQVKKGRTKVMKVRAVGDERRIEQTIPAIVSVEQWERVQAALSNNTLARSNTPDLESMPLLNRGLAYCGHCGSKCIAAKHHSGYRGYACPNRSGKTDGDRPACPGGSWFIKASDVDSDVWGKVREMMADAERFRAMMLAPIKEAQAKIAQAKGQEDSLAAELEQARRDRDTISRRMATEPDDTIAATYRHRLKETLAMIERLEARTGSQDREVARLTAYLGTLFAAASDWQDAQGNAVSAQAVLSLIAPPPAREQKRNLLRAIGVRVVIYSGKSDYARESGKRWDMQIIPGVYAQESMRERILSEGTHLYTWTDWLRAGDGA
jgi:site-specific DNA recombinase